VTVFVVDDERPVMQLCVTILELQGHRVEGFTRGAELLARVAAVVPDLVVVDYKMPNLGGMEVVRRLRADHPELRVVLISGHSGPDLTHEADHARVDAVLLKPFTPGELARTVADLLNGTPTSPSSPG
jgi:CheY-like chemotaxis protein